MGRILHMMPVLLIPGMLCDERVWSGVRARLQAPSSVVDLGACDSLREMAEAILEATREPSVWAGFSMGGMAAILAAASPATAAASLVVIATHGIADTQVRRALREAQIAEAQVDFEAYVAGKLLPAYFDESTRHRDLATLVADMARAQGADGLRRHVRAIIERPDIGEAAGHVPVPVTTMVGDGDRIVSVEAASQLAARFPHGTFSVLRDCGHMLPLEQPEAVAACLDGMAAGSP